jgi:DNA primase
VGGNVFTFLQEIEKIDFRDAVKDLATQYHIDTSAYQPTSTYTQHLQDEKEKMKRMHKLAQEFFVESLQKDTNALHYLKEKRKLTAPIITDF